MDNCNNESIMKSVFPAHSTKQNHYEVLEISEDATKIQVREAYIRLKSTYSNGSQALYSLISDEDARDILNQLEDAYRVLYDEILRREYDHSLSGAEPSARHNLVKDTDPFYAAFPGHESVSRKDHHGETEFSDDGAWKHGTGSVMIRPSESAKKKRFAQQALNNDIQEKIKERLENEAYDGSIIRDLRDIQGVTLNELQDRTKVSLQYIIALENNDFQTLPSLVYVKGFLKICLQYLGVQKGVDAIVNKYLESIKHWRESRGIEPY